jgi:flagellar biosynthesis/type III secretory pathway M-ring protein FliF/YscJ
MGPAWWKEWLPIAVGALAAIAVFIFLISFRRRRPRAEQVELASLPFPSRVQELETIIDKPASLPEGENPGLRPTSREASNTAMLMDEVRHHFMEESEGASRVLKAWLSEARKKTDTPKETV